jgi:hypothetical protein
MKYLKAFIFMSFVLAQTGVSAKTVGSSIEAFKLNTCDLDQVHCLTVKAESTVGSQAKMLHSLKKPEVVFTKVSDGVIENIKADSGYIDFVANQLVIYSKENRILKETAINLNNLERTVLYTNLK